MRDRASSELRLIFAPTNQAICSVAAIERALSNNCGMRNTNSRIFVRSHTSAQLSDNTSLLARYQEGVDRSALYSTLGYHLKGLRLRTRTTDKSDVILIWAERAE